MKIIFLISGLFYAFALQGQPFDLTKHQAFFQHQAQAYQAWLDHSNLSRAFRVHDIEVLKEGVALNLRFVSSESDVLSRTWLGVKEKYEKTHLVDLEEALFLKMLRLFDLTSQQAFLQIRNTYEPTGHKYFVKIYTLDNKLEIASSFPKGFFGKIEVELNLAVPAITDRDLDIPTLTKAEVYDRIYQFIELEYKGSQECQDNTPIIDAFFSLNDKLLVNILGLCRAVLDEEEELLFCDILKRLSWDCSSVKRETLIFEFEFDTKSKRIYCQLDGKYSNDYLLFHGKVRDMDDDPRFEKLLQSHGENFLKALKQWIER